jgi:hypothetical protein
MDCRNARLLLEFLRPRSTELEPSEAEALENHLADCPECGALAVHERRLDEHLGRAVRDVPVPEHLRDRLVKRLAVERDAWYRRRLLRWGGGAAAAAAVVFLLLWLGRAWWGRPADLDPELLIIGEARPTTSPDLVEGWFRDHYGVHVFAPSRDDFHYHLLEYYDLVNFADTGKRVPMLLFVYRGPADEARAQVFIVGGKEFKNLKDLANQPAKGSRGYRVKVIPSPEHPHVYYVVMYTQGAEKIFFANRRPAA